MTAFRDGEVTLRTNRRVDGFTQAVQEHGYQGVRAGELVIHSMDGFAGAIGVSDSDGKMSPVVHIYDVPKDEPRFVALLLRQLATTGYIESLAKGIRERSTSFDRASFRSLALPLPGISEQRAILHFLDRETAKIDAFIAKNEQLIALLTERRAAVIARAITEGVHARVSRAPSRIDWIAGAQSPTAWRAMRIGQFARVPSGSFLDANDISASGSIPVFGGGAQRGFTEHPNVDGETIVIGRVGANCGRVRLVSGRAYITDNALLVEPRIPLDMRWLALVLESMSLGQYSASTAQPLLTASTVRAKRVPLPPKSEQTEIWQYISERTNRIEKTMGAAYRAIELARERRAALISAAVTGKIDVGVDA